MRTARLQDVLDDFDRRRVLIRSSFGQRVNRKMKGHAASTHLLGEGHGDEGAEGREVAPWFEPQELEERVQVFEAVLDRRPGEDPATFRVEGATRSGGFRRATLDVMPFVEDDAKP